MDATESLTASVLSVSHDNQDKQAGTIEDKTMDARILEAAKTNPKEVIDLLSEGANIRATSDKGESVLYQLVSNPATTEEILLKFLEYMEEQTEENTKQKQDALVKALKEQNTKIATLLLKNTKNINELLNGLRAQTLEDFFENEASLRLLLEHGADLQKRQLFGNNPLNLACQSGSIGILKLLLEFGADPDRPSNSGYLPLQVAIRYGKPRNAQLVSILLEYGARVNEIGFIGHTSLNYACAYNQEECVKLLIAKNADPNKADSSGWTPLHSACKGGFLTIVDELLKYGANPNSVSNNGWTILHNASFFGRDQIVEKLLDHGADRNAVSKNGCSAIHLAAQEGYHKVTQLLIQKNSAVNVTDANKWTPLHKASSYDERVAKVVTGFESSDALPYTPTSHGKVIDILLKSGADIGRKTIDMETSLHLAAKSNNTECFQRLLPKMKDQDVFSRDANGNTALSFAADNKNPEMVRELLKRAKMADFGTRDIEEDMILWAAEREETHDIVVLLSKKGGTMSNKNIPCKNQYSALYWAALNGKLDIVWRLLSSTTPSRQADDDKKAAEVVVENILLDFRRGKSQREKRAQLLENSNTGIYENYEAILDILKDSSYVDASSQSEPCELPVLIHDEPIENFEASIVTFYANDSSAGFYPRFRGVKEVIYDEGPDRIMSRAQRTLRRAATRLRESVKYADEDFQFRWIHLPANNMQWMNDLNLRVFYDSKGNDKEDGIGERESKYSGPNLWLRMFKTGEEVREDQRLDEIDREERRKRKKEKDYNRVYQFFRKSWHLNATSEVHSMKAGCLLDSKNITEDQPQAAIYLPYLAFSAFPSEKNSDYMKLFESSKSHEIHGFRTLDESYYQFTTDKEGKKERDRRNRDQVVTKRIYRDGKAPLDKWVLIGVEQLWLWIPDNKTIITSSTHRVDHQELNTVRRAVLDELNSIKNGKGGRSIPRSPMEMSKFIVDLCILRFEEEKHSMAEGFQTEENPMNRSIEQFFSDAINEAAVKEAELFKRFTEEKESRRSQDFIMEAANLLCEVKDIRDELNMLKAIVNDQESVQGRLCEDSGSATQILGKLGDMNEITDWIHEAVNATIALEQNKISMKQSEVTVQQGKKLMAFTIATIIFLPMSFLVSLFNLNVTIFQHDSSGVLEYTPGWIFPILFCVSASVWLPLIMYTLYWNDDYLNKMREFVGVKIRKSNDSSTTSAEKVVLENKQFSKRPLYDLASRLPAMNFKRNSRKTSIRVDEEAIGISK